MSLVLWVLHYRERIFTCAENGEYFEYLPFPEIVVALEFFGILNAEGCAIYAVKPLCSLPDLHIV